MANQNSINKADYLTGTANQINMTAVGSPQTASLSSTLVMPGTCTLNADPTTGLQAATKQYVDAVAALGVEFKASVVCATTGALTATYANGTAGVGATLTNAGAMAAFSTDGITPAAGSRILVKNQASTFENGIYTLTVAGDGVTNWVMTRAVDFDTPAEIQPGAFVAVDSGTTLANNSFLQSSTVTAVGVDAITFSQFTYGTTFPSMIVTGNLRNDALTASRVVTTDSSKNLTSSSMTSADLPYAVLQNGAAVYALDTGAADAYVVTLSPAPAAYVTGMAIMMKAANANTTTSTINVNGLGAVTIKKGVSTNLAANDILTGQMCSLVYDGTNFQLNPPPSTGTGSVTSVGVTSDTLTVTNTPITTSGNIDIELPTSMYGNNLIINGDFQVWQRGAGGSYAANTITVGTWNVADRWKIAVYASSSAYVSQQAGSLTNTYCARVGRTNGNSDTSAILLYTNLFPDMVRGTASNYLTITFKARCGANYSPTASALGMTVYTGTSTSDQDGHNGAYTGTATVINSNVTLTTSWQTFTLTSAAAIGSTVTQICVNPSMTPTGTAGAADYFEITDVQLEIGALATAFERKTFNEQLALCRKYYIKSFLYTTSPAQSVGIDTGEFIWAALQAGSGSFNQSPMYVFPTQMRTTPTITLYNPAAANAQMRNEASAQDGSSTNTDNLTAQGFTVNGNNSATTSITFQYGIHFQAEAEL